MAVGRPLTSLRFRSDDPHPIVHEYGAPQDKEQDCALEHAGYRRWQAEGNLYLVAADLQCGYQKGHDQYPPRIQGGQPGDDNRRVARANREAMVQPVGDPQTSAIPASPASPPDNSMTRMMFLAMLIPA